MSTSTEDADADATRAARAADYVLFKRYAAYTFLIASPILIALPPRKIDLYTAALTGAFGASVNHVYREYHDGRSMVDALREKLAKDSTSNTKKSGGWLNELPSERAQEVQARLRAAREARIQKLQLQLQQQQQQQREEQSSSSAVRDELEKLKAHQQQFEDGNSGRSLADRIWTGNETEGWKERRLREEQKALDEGKGYGDLIMDHIWEVWNWGKSSSSPSSSSSGGNGDGNGNKKE